MAVAARSKIARSCISWYCWLAARAERVELERELLGLDAGVELAGLLRLADLARRGTPRNWRTSSVTIVAHRVVRPAVELGLDGVEEAAAARRPRRGSSPASRSSSASSRARPRGSQRDGPTTWSTKRRRAASIVASCSSSLEPKCANSPLLLMPSSVASRPIVRPSRPSTEARSAAAWRIDSRVRVAAAPAAVGLVVGGGLGAGERLEVFGGIRQKKVARPFDHVVQSTTDRAFYNDIRR